MTARLEFIIGRSGTGKTRDCLTAMRDVLREEPLGRQRILLVPEHMTYAAERALAEALTHGAGFLQVYVFGFRRLARQVLLETGGEHLPRISDIGRRILLKDILLQHSRELSVFQRSVHKRGFTEVLGHTIAELKRDRLSSDHLRQAADVSTGKHARLSAKLTELATIMDELAARMEGRLTDHTDRMERLAVQLIDAPFLRGAELWVDGFDFFNPQELAVFRALFRVVDTVHVSLTMDGRDDGTHVFTNLPENIYDTGLFARSYQTMHLLQQIFTEEQPSAQIGIRLMPVQHRARTEGLRLLEAQLFDHGHITPAKDDSIRIVEAANPRLEVETAAADILRLARDGGYRYCEIAVLVRDVDLYGDLLSLSFADCGIPFYLDIKRPSAHHPLAELLRAVAQMTWRGWAYETVFRALRTGFFPMLETEENEDAPPLCADWQEAVDRLENYCLAYGIRNESQWTATEPWDFVERRVAEHEPHLEGDEEHVREEQWLDQLRRRIAEPLSLLTGHLRRNESTARARTKALYDFLDELCVPQTLRLWSETADREGRLADAAAHRQIWSSCMALFDQLVEVRGDDPLSSRDYEELLSDGLDAMSIALIPPGLDHVTVASFDQNSIAGARAVFVIGANAGIMPRAGTTSGVFSDTELLFIGESLQTTGADSGHTIFGGRTQQSFLERYQLYRGFTEARDYLWVSYALSSVDGSTLAPSPLIARLRRISSSFFSIPLALARRDDPLLLSAPYPALSHLTAALREKKERGEMPAMWGDVYNWMLQDAVMQPLLRRMLHGLFLPSREVSIPAPVAARLFTRDRRLSGSTTRLETFRQCPFRHFAMYGLRLQQRDRYEFQSNDFGTLLHGILRGYGEWVRSAYGNDWCAALTEAPEKIEELLQELIPQVHSTVLMSRASYRHRIERIRCTAQQTIQHLTSWAAASSFHPYGFEISFGRRNDGVRLADFPLADGMTLSLRGQIDRLDVMDYHAYYLVLDYKTGATSLLLPEIRHGLKMQLLLYLFVVRSILDTEEAFPAGMLYAPVKNPVVPCNVRLDEAALRRKVMEGMKLTGMLLDDADIMKQLDQAADHICISFTHDNSPFKSSAKFVRSREEFQQLLAFLPQLIRATAEDILHGDIRVYPYRFQDRNACTYCDYHTICTFDPALRQGDVYHDSADNAQEAMEEIARIVEEVDRDGGSADIHSRPTARD